MFKASLAAARRADIFIGAAAVADYRPAKAAAHKIKKNAAKLAGYVRAHARHPGGDPQEFPRRCS